MTTTTIQAPGDGAWGEVRALLRLSVPIMVAQGGLTAMGITDTFMIGRISAVQMGGVALGNTVAFVVLTFSIGVTMGIEPLASQAKGAGEPDRAYSWYLQGLWAALLSSIPVMLGIVPLLWLLPRIDVSEAVVAATTSYVWFRLPSVPVNAMYGAVRSYLTSIQRTRPIVIAVVTANVANVGLDYVFLFNFDMGAAGVGLATTICWCLMFIIAAFAAYAERPTVRHDDGRAVPAPVWTAPDGPRLWTIFGLGMPIGLQLAAEVGVFSLVGLLVARMGEVPLGGHQIALTLASFTFMSAVGIAVGSTTLVGAHVGAGRSASARRTGILSIVVGGAFMACGGVVFLTLDAELAGLFAPTDEAVARLGAQLLQIA